MRDFVNHLPAGVRGLLCAAALLGCAGLASAGDVEPTSMRVELAPLNEIQEFAAKPVDIEKELRKDANEQKSGPKRFAVANNVKLNPDNSGVWEEAGNGLAVWRLRISADFARSINLGFTDYLLPDKATLFLYSADGKHVEGPYTSEHNSDAMELWTPVIAGEDMVVELTVPIEKFHDFRLEIGRVNAAYRDFGLRTEEGDLNGVPKSGSCNLDVICGAADGFPEVDAWRGEIPAVGAYTINGTDTCTGSLVNNTAQDCRSLFITANHCGLENNPGGIVVYWNYESSTCRTPGSAASGTPVPRTGFPTSSGSTLLMTTPNPFSSTGPDCTLVELNDGPATLAAYGVTYAGWDHSDVATFPGAVTIHHPNVDEKRISFENQTINRTQGLTSTPGGAGVTHWWITDWDTGTTEPGSSGSPLYNTNNRLIGVLSGGQAACGNDLSDWYGRIAVAWDGSSASARLRDHLDPLGTGQMTLDTKGAGPLPFLTAGPLSDIEASGLIGGPFTGGMGTVTISNMTDASANYSVTVLSDPAGIVQLSGMTSGSIADEGTADFTISLNTGVAATLGAGLYTGTVQISDLTNGQNYTRDLILEVGRASYPSTDTPLSINDNATTISIIDIFDNLCIDDLNVEVQGSHTYQGDLVITLQGPDGTTVTLRDNQGGSAAWSGDTFDDEGNAPSGPGMLSDFDGTSALGSWTLSVTDTANQDQGTLTGWSLQILSSGTDCPPRADDQSLSVKDAELAMITLTGAGDGALTYQIESLPTDGVLIDPSGNTTIMSAPYMLSGDMVKYISDLGFSGNDAFTFTTDDGSLASSAATVSIAVDASEDAYFFPMDSDPGWSTDGGWAFGVPAGADGDPTSGSTGSNVYGYNLAGAYGNNITPAEYLTTTALDCTGLTNVALCFERWLGTEHSQFDQATIDVSNDGFTWTNIYLNPTGFGNSIQDTAWSTQSYDISAVADGESTVFIRWGHETDGSVTFSGWNIDDVRIKADGVGTDPTGGCCLSDASCAIMTASDCASLSGDYQGDGTDCSGICMGGGNDCAYDVNNTGAVDIVDFTAFSMAFNSMVGDPNYDPALDFNNTGTIDIVDFTEFSMEFGRTDCLLP